MLFKKSANQDVIIRVNILSFCPIARKSVNLYVECCTLKLLIQLTYNKETIKQDFETASQVLCPDLHKIPGAHSMFVLPCCALR
jgi:hypothetical protein